MNSSQLVALHLFLIAALVHYELEIFLTSFGYRLKSSEMVTQKSVDLLGLARQKWGKGKTKRLSRSETKIFRCIGNGEVADFSSEIESENDPANAESWRRERTLNAGLVQWLCTDSDVRKHIPFRSVRIKGAVISFDLDLNSAMIPFPLEFIKCVFNENILMKSASIHSLSFEGTRTNSIIASRLNVSFSVSLSNGFRSKEVVHLDGASIGGDLNCTDGKFKSGISEIALGADNAEVKGNVSLMNGFEADGTVTLVGATIGGDLNCTGGKFNSGNSGKALAADKVDVKGSVHLSSGFEAEGPVTLVGATIGSDLNCSGGKFKRGISEKTLSADSSIVKGILALMDGFEADGRVSLTGVKIGSDLNCSGGKFKSGSGEKALGADNAEVNGVVALVDGFEAEGSVTLVGATIGSDLNCIGGNFKSGNSKLALGASNANVKGVVRLCNGFESDGKVSLMGATIGSDLNCIGGKFRKGNSELALIADKVNVKGILALMDGFEADGPVTLVGATIGSDLNCKGGKFKSGNNEKALSADNADVKGIIALMDGFEADGSVTLIGATIGSDLNCKGGKFKSGNSKRALAADNADVKGIVALMNGFEADGLVTMTGATIGSDLNCTGGEFRIKKNGTTLNVRSMHIQSDVILHNTLVEGQLDFSSAVMESSLKIEAILSHEKMTLILNHAIVQTLSDDPACWPDVEKLEIDGFRYSQIRFDEIIDIKKRISWLKLQKKDYYYPQPYEQLASVLRKSGHDKDADKVLIAKEKEKKRIFFKSIKSFRWVPRLLRKEWWWHHFMGRVVGYGYRPWNAILIGLVIIALGATVFTFGKTNFSQTRSTPIKGYPSLQPVVFSIDAFIPLVDLRQVNYWLPDAKKGDPVPFIGQFDLKWGGAIRIWFWIQIILGWAISTMFVVAFTRLVRS